MTGKIKLLAAATILTVILLSASPALAQVQPIVDPANVNCGFAGIKCAGNETILGNIIPQLRIYVAAFTTLLAVLAAIFLIYAAVIYISSRGNEEDAARAKRQITYAIIGLILAGGVGFIINLVEAPAVEAPRIALQNYINPFINMIIGLISLLAAIYLVYAGIKYITSAGDEEDAKLARLQIVYAIIGLFIVGSVDVILKFFGWRRTPAAAGDIEGDLPSSIYNVVNQLLIFVGIAAVIYVIYAGVRYITSGGDQDTAALAKRQILYALLGVIVVIISAVLVNLVVSAV